MEQKGFGDLAEADREKSFNPSVPTGELLEMPENRRTAAAASNTVMELAARHGYGSQAAIRRAIQEVEGLEIPHQRFSQWINETASFPNDFAPIFSRAVGLTHDETIELSLALSFGQRKTRQLRKGVA